MRSMLGALAEPWDYCCVEELVAEFGQSHVMSPAPETWEQCQIGKCFHNCSTIERWSDERYLYCEGFAGTPALHHAWLFDTFTGRFFDPTWDWHHAQWPFYLGCIIQRTPSFPVFGRWDERMFKLMSDTYPGFHTRGLERAVMTRRQDTAHPTVGPWVRSTNRLDVHESDRLAFTHRAVRRWSRPNV